MTEPRYIFNATGNSYFRGYDLQITDNETQASITVNVKENLLAVNVKDDEIRRTWPQDVQDAADKIGDQAGEDIYTRVQEDFWRWANEEAQVHGFDGVYAAGHSGGWCAVQGTDYLDGMSIIEPSGADKESVAKFLEFAFAITQAIEGDGGFREQFYEELRSAPDPPPPPVTVELSSEAFIGLCGLVQPTDDVDGERIMLEPHVWVELREKFPKLRAEAATESEPELGTLGDDAPAAYGDDWEQ